MQCHKAVHLKMVKMGNFKWCIIYLHKKYKASNIILISGRGKRHGWWVAPGTELWTNPFKWRGYFHVRECHFLQGVLHIFNSNRPTVVFTAFFLQILGILLSPLKSVYKDHV